MAKWLRSGAVLGGVVTFTFLGCSATPPAPKAPDAAKLLFDSDPKAVRVQMARQPSAPLTVDWSMHDRKALEARVHQKGAIVVHFDDNTLEPLPDCRPPGSYVFTGVTHGRELIDARTTAELAANFPLTAVRLGGRYQEAEQLSADLHVVGMANLDRPLIKHAEVQGSPCRGATHVITEITHGGFRFGSTRDVSGGVHAEAPGVGGGSAAMQGSAGRLTEDGEVASCKQATWKDAEPPAQCGGVIRIRLVPIETQETKESAATCPPGLRWTGSGCTSEQLAQKTTAAPPPSDVGKINVASLPEKKPAAAPSFKCNPEKPSECYTQCLAGNADSCSYLGVAFVTGKNIQVNVELGRKLFDVACKGGSSDGCFQAGAFAIDEKKYPLGLEYSAKSCEMGNPQGCTNQAYMLWRGLGGVRKDPQRAYELFTRACNRREFVSCNNAGVMTFFDTTGTLKRNPAAACKMFGQACEAGETTSCANLGICMEHGIDRPKDVEAAFKQYATACDAGNPFGCVWGALLLEEAGRGNPKAIQAALQQYEKTCESNDRNGSCVSQQDIKTALPNRWSDDMVDRHACDNGATTGLACYNAALVYERGLAGAPNPSRASLFLRRACNDFDMKKACRPAR